MLMLARKQPWLGLFLDDADIVFCDGAGVQLASLLLTGARPCLLELPVFGAALLKEVVSRR